MRIYTLPINFSLYSDLRLSPRMFFFANDKHFSCFPLKKLRIEVLNSDWEKNQSYFISQPLEQGILNSVGLLGVSGRYLSKSIWTLTKLDILHLKKGRHWESKEGFGINIGQSRPWNVVAFRKNIWAGYNST